MKPPDTSNTSLEEIEPDALIPLLQPGFHPLTLSEVEALTVTPFQTSSRRGMIWKGFQQFFTELQSFGVRGHVWLDGSFLTKKIEPDDIDLLIALDRQSIIALPVKERSTLQNWLNSRPFLKTTYYCDVYFIDAGNAEDVKYWSNWYGLCADRTTPKGIPVVRIDHD